MSKFTTISKQIDRLKELHRWRHHFVDSTTILALLFAFNTANSQWKIIDHCHDEHNDTLVKKNLLEATQFLNELYRDRINEGYLECVIDTTSIDSITFYCVHYGRKYLIDSIFTKHPDNPERTHISRKSEIIAFNADNMIESGTKALKSYADNGYPFVSLQLDTILFRDSVATIFWRIDKGAPVTMDSLYIRSDDRIPRHYLTRALEWHKGKPYRESTISQADDKIRQTAFLKNAQPAALLFSNQGANLILYPARKPSNTFQGILGIRPNDITGRIMITGDIELRLLNSLNTGEELYLNWRKLQTQTQDLEAKTAFNYVLGSPFGPDASMKIYKRDSTFISVKLNGGISWKPNFNSSIRAFAERSTTTTLKPSFLFPENTNISATYFGISYSFSELDNPSNPRKGLILKGEIAQGKRSKELLSTIEQNQSIEKYEALKGELELKSFIPTFKKQCIMLGAYASSLQTDSIAQNEMYRIGGLRTIRGIDEESILATTFSIITLEYRYLIDNQTSVYVFTDQAWWEKKSIASFDRDTPFSFGLGLNLKTNSGVFSFNYALAEQFSNPILVKNAKISFGFRSVF
jgi:outer membrane protein assembly factor BamA